MNTETRSRVVHVHSTDTTTSELLTTNNFIPGDVVYMKNGDVLELGAMLDGSHVFHGTFDTVQEAIKKLPFVLSPDARIKYV